MKYFAYGSNMGLRSDGTPVYRCSRAVQATGIYIPLERNAVQHSHYLPPDPAKPGDFNGALLSRDVVRAAVRSGAGPFRSLGRLSVDPRPFQYSPLIMALRLDPVRLLLADDVGVGKTIGGGNDCQETAGSRRHQAHRSRVRPSPV